MHCALSTLLNKKVALLNKDYASYNDENEMNEFIIKMQQKNFQ